MNLKLLFTILSIVLCFTNVLAKDAGTSLPSNNADKVHSPNDEVKKGTLDQDLRSVMHDFYKKIIEIRPIIKSMETFKSKENQESVRSALDIFLSRLTKIKDSPGFNGEDQAATVGLFLQHLRDTRSLLDLGELERAYHGVRQSTEFCFSCHTRMPQVGDPQLDWKQDIKAQDATNALVTADFYFITRRYEYSMNIYDHLLRSFPDTVLVPQDIRGVYLRKLLVFARVWRNPSLAVTNFGEDLKNKKLPIVNRQEVKMWQKSFAEWAKQEKSDKGSDWNRKKRTSFALKVLSEMEGYRGPSDSQPYLVNLLRSSGLLYEDFIKAKNSDEKAETLFYLGKTERILSQSSFALLGDLYLKECVRLAPRSTWASRCLGEYRSYLEWRFPGSTSMPEDIKAELKKLEDIVAQGKGNPSK